MPSPTPAAPAPAATPIDTLVAERRSAWGGDVPAGRRPWGLALSGGGIRSATFCFGLLKALAAQRLLRQFDLLSTVSGGGYIGATLGQLFNRHEGAPEAVEQAVGQADSRVFGAWLRANGRYLIPKGGSDLLFAGASFGRNLLGVHIELAVLCLLLGSVLVGLDLAAWWAADLVFQQSAEQGGRWLPLIGTLSGWPTLWGLLPLVAWPAAVLACAYWVLPNAEGEPSLGRRTLGLGLSLLGSVALLDLWQGDASWLARQLPGQLIPPHALLAAGVALLSAWIGGLLLASVMSAPARVRPDAARNRLTHGLAAVLTVGAAVGVLGAMDWLAWQLAHQLGSRQAATGGALLLALAALRAILPKVSDLPKSLGPLGQRLVLGAISALGTLLVGLIAVFWFSLVHRAVSNALFQPRPPALRFDLAAQWLPWLSLPALGWVLLSWRNRDFMNRSSLYSFYRARLVRSYLGAANAARVTPPLAPAGHGTPHWSSVGDVQADDDVPMAAYQPQRHGGPVHLVNVCVNQTRNPRGGLYNQDRKGLLMTVAPGAQVRVANQAWQATEGRAQMSLGTWTAISGAAVAPGLGASTRPGLAAILMLAGLRLGYWWDSGRAGLPRTPKYRQFRSELFANFSGAERRDWYLSDGGHYENTAAVALLREECELIVIADCGADPRYAFGDLEHLVRQARIDLQADITFLRPRDRSRIDASKAAPPCFGSLAELASEKSQACLALARVDYRASGRSGHLLLVKPNLCGGLPVDLVNYKADNPLFPQEPTTDQFFSEAQWESYFLLGQVLGSKLDLPLHDIAGLDKRSFEPDDGAVHVTDEQGRTLLKYATERLPSRILSTGAVSASLGMGAVLSVAASAWQAASSQMALGSQASRIDPAAYKELSEHFGRLSPTGGATPSASALGEMATALLRVGFAACTQDNTSAFQQSTLFQLMLSSAKNACTDTKSAHPSCKALVSGDGLPACLQQVHDDCTPRYWTRDYGRDTPTKANCWGIPPGGPDPQSKPLAGAFPLPAANPAAADAPVPASAPLPTPPLSGAPAPAPYTAPAGGLAQAGRACANQTVYVQIYGPELRDEVRALREPWRATGASVPPIEDVWDSARRAGRPLPQPVSAPTVRYHPANGKACAAALQRAGGKGWVVQPLPASLGSQAQKNVLEVWIPPGTVLAPLP